MKTRDQVLATTVEAPDPRMRASGTVLAYSGLRISEALSLRWQGWDGEGMMRVMRAKGGRPRPIPVPATLQAELESW